MAGYIAARRLQHLPKAPEIGGIEVPEALEKHRDVQMSSALDEFKKPIEDEGTRRVVRVGAHCG